MITEIVTSRNLLNAIFENARIAYPREMVLLLRGETKRERVEITDIIIPPLAFSSSRSASFPASMLPMDLSLIGSVHSHPSGSLEPSVVDLNRAFGRIIMIVTYPFLSTENVAVYNRQGKKATFCITE